MVEGLPPSKRRPKCFKEGVVAMSVGNEALVALVRDRLMGDSRTAAQPIDVCCSEGFVSLIGFVDTLEQKSLAVQLVTGLIGVRNIKDEIVVRSLVVPGSAPAAGERAAL